MSIVSTNKDLVVKVRFLITAHNNLFSKKTLFAVENDNGSSFYPVLQDVC
jgi:hypothetical protein